jgi:hypothetical protein
MSPNLSALSPQQSVGRIPYASTKPKRLISASEVTSLDFLRLHGLPVPEVYSYSITSENPAGIECIFMELIGGLNLGDVWTHMPGKARNTVVAKLVKPRVGTLCTSISSKRQPLLLEGSAIRL